MSGATFTLLIKDLIEGGWTPPLSYYPIFDEAYRDTLNGKIIRHYMMREIGWETVELFEYSLQTKMGEIMPLYNQLYKSQLLTFDPITTNNYRDVMSGSLDITGHHHNDTGGTADSTSNNTADSKSRAVGSDTPQMRLAGDEDYASGLNDVTSGSTTTAVNNATSSGSETIDSTNNQAQASDRTSLGYNGVSPSKLLRDWRDQMLNIDMMVITDLEPLFMSLWDNGDSMSDVSLPGYPVNFGGIFTPGFPFPYYF